MADDQRKFEVLKKQRSGSLPDAPDQMIYIDEVTFSMKTFKPYAWSHRGASVTQLKDLGSQPCQAVVGAASATQGLILWHVRAKAFDAQSFRDFLTDLRDSIGPGLRTLMLDNASIHRAKATV